MIPVQPRTFDVWSLEFVAQLVEEAQSIHPSLRAVTVLNLADARGTENAEAVEALVRYAPSIRYLPQALMRRKVYSDAVAQGKGVLEMHNKKASQEFLDFIAILY